MKLTGSQYDGAVWMAVEATRGKQVYSLLQRGEGTELPELPKLRTIIRIRFIICIL